MFTNAEYKTEITSLQSVYFRQFRYNGIELQLKPHVNTKDSSSEIAAPVAGLFFEKLEVFIGAFEKSELGLPATALQTGAAWEMSEDGGTTWEGVFMATPPRKHSYCDTCDMYRFIADANLTVTYEQGQGTYSQSEGNQVEDVVSASFTAVVSQQQRPSDLQLPGTQVSSIYVEGYHSSPKAAPTVNKQQRLSATLNSVAGEFVMVPVVQPPSGVTEGSGDVIKGFFVVKGTQ